MGILDEFPISKYLAALQIEWAFSSINMIPSVLGDIFFCQSESFVDFCILIHEQMILLLSATHVTVQKWCIVGDGN